MDFEGIDVPIIAKAVTVYLDVAFAEDKNRPTSLIDPAVCQTVDEALSKFQKDTRAGNMRRYTLRLGNPRYPFMKLVFQELLIRNRFFFAVDTHDDIGMQDSFPDYEQWLELKRYNHRLKDLVERGWQAAGVPTFTDIVAQVERETPPGPALKASSDAAHVLIVDDEVGIAHGVEMILTRQGYRTTKVHSAEAALEVLAKETPDLILSDLEMGGISGLDLAAKVRADPRTAPVPFILATAASIDPTNFRIIDGFLVKPYEAQVLIKFIATQIKNKKIPEPTSEQLRHEGERS